MPDVEVKIIFVFRQDWVSEERSAEDRKMLKQALIICGFLVLYNIANLLAMVFESVTRVTTIRNLKKKQKQVLFLGSTIVRNVRADSFRSQSFNTCNSLHHDKFNDTQISASSFQIVFKINQERAAFGSDLGR